jgi:hypothetical protein
VTALRAIDQEVRAIVEEGQKKAMSTLTENKDRWCSWPRPCFSSLQGYSHGPISF